MGNLLGISPSICAACGMAAVFCGVTNCPITSILIAFEMFGFKGVSFYLIAVSISYASIGILWPLSKIRPLCTPNIKQNM